MILNLPSRPRTLGFDTDTDDALRELRACVLTGPPPAERGDIYQGLLEFVEELEAAKADGKP